MGLFSKKIKSPVQGTASITGCSSHTGDGTWQNCRMHLVVQVEGWAPYPAEVHQLAPRKKWPQPGMTVPVIVSKDDPQKLKVDFDSMPDTADIARRMAAQQAAALRGEGVSGVVPGAMGPVTVVGDLGALSPEQRAKIEQLTGLDLDGAGVAGGAAQPADRVGQLERLATLRDSGALTDAEFEREKRRILGA